MTTSTLVEAVAPRATVSHHYQSHAQAPASDARAYRHEPAQRQGHLEAPGESAWSDVSHSTPVCAWKRSVDISCILFSLPFILPLMAVVALWIKLVSRGPAIFRQERIGRNGQRFTLYKFRSMQVNADTSRHSRHFNQLVRSDSPMVKLDLLSDSRLIPMGCLLRAAGLDELPQFFNVLRGDMSLVGPRPCLPEELRFFSLSQRVRFQALPGLTGIWQSEGKGVSTFAEMNDMDARYVRTASLPLDLAIMCRTPLALLRQTRLACKTRRRSAEKASAHHGAKPLGDYSAQRLR
jgi:lipopolysaccharide/colanic/teichoic acid biosynthesis glycosyltransferase